MKHEKLFELAKPYLKKNDFGEAHTQRVFELARKNFKISDEIFDEVYALIILHDIGGSSIKEQYQKGPNIASALMKKLDYPEETIKNVTEMMRKHHEKLIDPSETFMILFDSDQLVKFSEEEFVHYKVKHTNLDAIIDSMYYQDSKILARRMLVKRTMQNP
jgi:hypothetical protein